MSCRLLLRLAPVMAACSHIFIQILITSTMTSEMAKLGGFTTEEIATEEELKICIQVKQDMENKTGTSFKDFIPLLYRCQAVNGINYLVKIKVDCEEDVCVHAMIYQAFDGGKLTLTRVQYPKSISDPLV